MLVAGFGNKKNKKSWNIAVLGSAKVFKIQKELAYIISPTILIR